LSNSSSRDEDWRGIVERKREGKREKEEERRKSSLAVPGVIRKNERGWTETELRTEGRQLSARAGRRPASIAALKSTDVYLVEG
jgi:hypothetical protein